MLNKSEKEKILEKLKEVAVKGFLRDEEMTKKLSRANRIFSASVWAIFISLISSLFISLFISSHSYFYELIFYSLSIVGLILFLCCGYSLFLKNCIRNNLIVKFEKEIWVQNDHSFEKGLDKPSEWIMEFSHFKKDLLRSALTWCHHDFTAIGSVHAFFSGAFLGWLTSILSGIAFGYIYAKYQDGAGLEHLINFIMRTDNSVAFQSIMSYCMGFLFCNLDKRLNQSMGMSLRQRRKYMIALLECAICTKSEREGSATQMPVPPPHNQDRPMFFLTQLRNFICK